MFNFAARRHVLLICVTTISVLTCAFYVGFYRKPRTCDLVSEDTHGDVVKYVSFYPEDIQTGWRGLGNQMFSLAAVLYLSKLTGRLPVVHPCLSSNTDLERYFKISLASRDKLCPCYVFNESLALAYDDRVKRLVGQSERGERTILLRGYFQSWKYLVEFEPFVREQLKFRPDVTRYCKNFLESKIPVGWTAGSFVRVGVHVRRNDILKERQVQVGYTTPDLIYFTKAMNFMIKRFTLVQFVVSSDDQQWAKDFIVSDLITPEHQNNSRVIYIADNPGRSLAILSLCDHVIMSTGTFGWWAAWLSGGTTIYYDNWPRAGSGLMKQFRHEDFFPPKWIGMTD